MFGDKNIKTVCGFRVEKFYIFSRHKRYGTRRKIV